MSGSRGSTKKVAGQAIIEFTFAMMGLFLLIYGLVMIFRWTGVDLAERRFDHDRLLTNPGITTMQQLNPDFHAPVPVDGLLYTKNDAP